MKRILTFLSFLVVVFAYAESSQAQDPRPIGVSSTSAPVQSRYEIIVTTSRVRAVLKLDKYTGEVFELARNKTLVKNKDEEHAWQRTKRLPNADKDEATNEVNYQIYASGEYGIYTYLINTGTGATWILAKEAGKEELYWYPLKHQ
ncbi:MAG: hypothetical protein OEQ28_00635 [Acidobacteriota bacterium]|nr:hypothetical protein [Acidobacteriota bacterium]